jgi:ribosome-binding factor A
MIDDGYRLSFSISDDGFSIVDNISGNGIICTRGYFTLATLDRSVALQHIKNLQEALLSSTKKRLNFKGTPIISFDKTVLIRENAHYDWTIGYDRTGASLKDNVIHPTLTFDKGVILSSINRVYAEILTKSYDLSPKRDIVRRIADAGLLVWVYKGHSVVVFEKDVSGNCMANCMIDGVYFMVVVVSVSKEMQLATLYTTSLEELLSVPLDDSILAFYDYDENAFDD